MPRYFTIAVSLAFIFFFSPTPNVWAEIGDYVPWDPTTCVGSGATPVPAFPGAEGYGAEMICGGRGGQILEVSNLNDEGEGSLRAALETHNNDPNDPKASVIVFRVGGTIVLKSPLYIFNPNLTIAGQTAPGDGILVRTPLTDGFEDGHTEPQYYETTEEDARFTPLHVAASNVIVRHLRIRPGNDPSWVCDDDRDNDGICWGAGPSTSGCSPGAEPPEGTYIAGYVKANYDNCPQARNGPNGGTCVVDQTPVDGSSCSVDGDCQEYGDATCVKDQRDSDEDGIGDACDRAPGVADPPSLIDLKLYPPGDSAVCYNGYSTMDAVQIGHAQGSIHHVILDHMSLSWATDEVLSLHTSAPNDVHDIIIQYSIISEGLNEGHHQLNHGLGFLTDGSSNNISYHHNVIAQHQKRCPKAAMSGAFDAVNNVIVNCWSTFHNYTPEPVTRLPLNVVGTLYIPGFRYMHEPGDTLYDQKPSVNLAGPDDVLSHYLYVNDNIGPLRPTASEPDKNIVEQSEWNELVEEPQTEPSVRVSHDQLEQDTGAFLDSLFASVGARPDRRDSVDTRVLAQARAAHDECLNCPNPFPCCSYGGDPDPDSRLFGYSPTYGGLINNQADTGGVDENEKGYPLIAGGTAPVDTDHDGMPDWFEHQYGLDPEDPDDGPVDPDGDFYTNLEDYLNGPECNNGADSDGDGVCDTWDNCDDEPNPSQGNADQDDMGDACDFACSDGLDNDGDDDIDDADSGCHSPGDFSEELDCADGLDNDHDGEVDLADSGCLNEDDPTEGFDEYICFNGIDDDGDGYMDMNDPGCRVKTQGYENPECDNDDDDDGDGYTDLEDPDCQGYAWWNDESSTSCGPGFEFALLLPGLLWLRRKSGRRITE